MGLLSIWISLAFDKVSHQSLLKKSIIQWNKGKFVKMDRELFNR